MPGQQASRMKTALLDSLCQRIHLLIEVSVQALSAYCIPSTHFWALSSGDTKDVAEMFPAMQKAHVLPVEPWENDDGIDQKTKQSAHVFLSPDAGEGGSEEVLVHAGEAVHF